MDARGSEPTKVERKSERELVGTRTFNAPARIVFEAWTKPELLKLWWAPKSTGVSLLSCEADVRVGGGYRFEFGHEGSKPIAFFGRYIEVAPHSRLVWTNEESDDGAVTTVTFEEKGGKTLLVMHELLSLEGSSRRCHRRDEGWDARDVRAAGRASRHLKRERGTVVKPSIRAAAARRRWRSMTSGLLERALVSASARTSSFLETCDF